ncbi:MAG TPA: hypothetical protein VE219_00095 [Candidatus Sulfotelmatobacter sp.]|jgi:hypothetical protein|nr:hypothetical protein [Candidatus Sulfotelmatobacter sp.]
MSTAPAATAAVSFWLILYLTYKLAWPRDFGIPVRRRLLRTRLEVVNDRIAYVPLWWSDLQVQRSLKRHWKESLHTTLADTRPASEQAPF